ncbi:class II fumarate hydratase [Ligilactobacillus salivarius]|uniref:Fumarate hydratase class II n=1 Tax=Ligilactobacillus salivarius TaxID=1624 RepID=A0ABD7YW30_9LACO|nr:class II fumarate hydratase [Ligilactobacillus salivarius]WHS05466.1 class II fumarate hydratase [Ligilactobacillus salivarius]WHS08458.1 class II fumarate hydratase [Ligilactobacillus salivarius]WHS09378.1 class II fumarate hydratase [Ligilactobacillus salivarius]WHS13318.1 class II fumarate hydratase [Ligilactobacillus salivarius]WHS18061.1 class II fumarate hydratase [Ligilactobacillus salivarius]
MSEFRIEEDTLGEVKIPETALWGPQTERSRNNFPTGRFMPIEIIRALLQIKKAAAQSNMELNQISEAKGKLIVESIDTLLALSDEDLRKDFPLKVYQTGSGTQTNMNCNEVVAHQAAKLNPELEILPNDDVNKGQSSNDIFPTAMNIVAADAVAKLEESAQHLIDELKKKQEKYWRVVKIGRTHLQDATPLTFGQEVSGWVSALEHDLEYLKQLDGTLLELAMGGTAVGTGLNAAPGFADVIAEKVGKVYGHEFTAKSNKFYGLSHHSNLNVVHGAMKTLADDLMKIANDVRFLASGPRAGYDELNIPANEPGSSIMPGKVNPTQAEAITMAAVRVTGNDVVVGMASSQGNFEMNVYKPVLIEAFLESADLLAGTMRGFADKMISGLTVNEARMKELVDNSLMTVTALSPHIGYHDSAKIAQKADKEGTTLREAAIASGKVTPEQFDEWVDPLKMTNIDR